MSKKIVFGENSFTNLVNGIEVLSEAVKTTLGPKGKNVILDKGFGTPIITKDGVTVANEVEMEDEFENVGCSLIKEAANKTNEMAGDGTTTAIVLAQAIIKEGIKMIGSGISRVDIKSGIEKGVKLVVDEIKKMSKAITTDEEIEQVASISANDPKIGKIISDAIKMVGKDGVISVEEGQSFETRLETKDGMQFDKGYVSPYMATNPTKKDGAVMVAEYNNIPVLITDRTISTASQLIGLLQSLNTKGKKELLIIANSVEGEALATLVVNKLQGKFNCLAVKAPSFGDNRKDILEDIAALTGATVITEEAGLTLETATQEHLGEISKVIAGKNETTLIGKCNDVVAERIDMVKKQLDKATNEITKERLQERYGKLTGKIAVVKVGAATEAEMEEKKYRIEDALEATKAAVKEGIVVGGGVALLNAIKVLPDEPGCKILAEALTKPLYQIAENAGENGDSIVSKVLEGGKGFNAFTGKFENLVAVGVIDPAKVTRLALQNAASTAMMILTTNAVITEKPKVDK